MPWPSCRPGRKIHLPPTSDSLEHTLPLQSIRRHVTGMKKRSLMNGQSGIQLNLTKRLSVISRKAAYRMEAEKRIFEISTRDSSIEAYHLFITKYPNNPHVPTAWRELYNLSTRDYTEDAFLRFQENFPGYPFMDELEKDFRLQKSLLMPFRKKQPVGYIDEQGTVMISPQYEDASLFSEGRQN